MNKERIEYYAHLTVTVIGVALAAFLVIRYLFVPVLPFLIAWGVAFLVRPAAAYLSRKIRLPKKIISATLAACAVVVGIGAVTGITAYGLSELWQLLTDFASNERLYEILAKIADPIGSLFGEGEGAAELEQYLGDTLSGAISSLLGGIVSILTTAVKRIPSVLFFLLITVISAVYFALYLDKINARVRAILPDRIENALCRFKNSFFSVGLKYIRSYLLLMLITFAVMLVGFLVLGVQGALLLSVIVALLDILPLIGVGTVLVPWSIFEIIFGSVPLGIGLIVLLVVHEIIRQLAEPRIIGKSLGIHPIISLILLYVGYSVFGFFGLIAVPLVCVIAACFKGGSDKNEPSEVA
ncbi:MAG: sporulation integral membrane protein YtvI [Clostridia bacterium]|nr:sporulation integral membrane protein YtvI [Clostridia bacterium]